MTLDCTIRCEYRNGVEHYNPKVQEYLRQLERVPLNLQEIIANEGAYIVFFNGPITDNPEMQPVKGVRPQNWDNYTWDDLRAGHDPNSKAILIGIEGIYVGVSDPFLHEFGHSFDDGIGKHIFGRSLSQKKDVLHALKTEPFSNKFFGYPREYVANSVELFYRSDSTRRQLEKNQHLMIKILYDIEFR